MTDLFPSLTQGEINVYDAAAGSGGLAVHGEVDDRATRWVDRCLVSPLHGALVQVVESAGLLAGADLVAGRVYGAFDGRPCAYVGTPGLALSPHQRGCLQGWPVEEGSLFEQLVGMTPVDRPMPLGEACSLGEPLDDGRLGVGLEPVLEVGCRLCDGFIVTLSVEHRCRAALLLLRHCQRPDFDDAQRDAVMVRRPILRNVLRRGLSVQQPPQPSAAELHDRLSQTERDVLDLLCQARTERQIAAQLDRSPHTVHVHVKSIYRKLGVHSRQQLRCTIERLSDANAN